MVLLQLSSMFVAAYPVEKVVNTARDDASAVVLGEHANHRTIVVVFCMCYAFLLALAQGYRAGRMSGQKTSARFSDMLVYTQGFVSTAFVFAVGINNAGLGLSTDQQCFNAIRVCIAMYGAAKTALYLFLLERVHIVRAPFIDRVKDPVWVVGAILTVIGWAAIIAYEYIAPRAELSRVDGICRIGIRPDSAIAVIVLDTVVNVALAAIFIWQLRPALSSFIHRETGGSSKLSAGTSTRSLLNIFRTNSDEGRTTARVNSARNVKAMLLRNVVGSCLLLCAQIANNVLFLTWPFATHSHVCQLMCLTDIVLGMLVTNWLTVRSTTETKEVSQTTTSTSGMTSVTRRPTMDFTAQEYQTSQLGLAKSALVVHTAREND